MTARISRVAVGLAVLVATLVTVSATLFAAAEVVPGDAAAASLGATASAEQIAARRAEWGLDAPLHERYLSWLGGLFRGDLGTSMMTGRPVIEELHEPALWSALLVALTAVVTISGSLLLGVASGLRPGGWTDRLISTSTMVAVATPEFVVASLLVAVCAGPGGLLPAVSMVPVGGSPLDSPEILVLPVLSLAAFSTAWAAQLVRATVIDANTTASAEAARLAGLPEHRVLLGYVLPAAAPGCAQGYAWLLGGLAGGTAVVERVFNYPGVSVQLLAAVRSHDPAVLEAVGLAVTCLLLLALWLADGVGWLLTPQRRTAA